MNKNVYERLASAAAIIGIIKIIDTFPDFITTTLKFCLTNKGNMLGGLLILESIVLEFDELIIPEKKRNKVIIQKSFC